MNKHAYTVRIQIGIHLYKKQHSKCEAGTSRKCSLNYVFFSGKNLERAKKHSYSVKMGSHVACFCKEINE
jgi:hypothetical protein